MLKYFNGENHSYIVMEYCEGGDLINRLENGTISDIKKIFKVPKDLAEKAAKGSDAVRQRNGSVHAKWKEFMMLSPESGNFSMIMRVGEPVILIRNL